MAKFWNYDVAIFQEPALFVGQKEEDYQRRDVLLGSLRRGDIMSFYEYRSLPPDERLAIALEQERIANQDYRTVDHLLGKTADGYTADTASQDGAYLILDDLSESVVMREIVTLSTSQYLVKIKNWLGEESLLPSRFIFRYEQVAKFMRQELRAYAASPDVRP